jgi:hypothetical protein
MSKQGGNYSKQPETCTVSADDAHRRDTCTEVVTTSATSLVGRLEVAEIEYVKHLAWGVRYCSGRGEVSEVRRMQRDLVRVWRRARAEELGAPAFLTMRQIRLSRAYAVAVAK